ncbi:MAG: glycosyltransferase family 4 protein [Planctomycetota bacterium]
MKVLQVISGTMLNGALTYCKFLATQLAQQGHDVTILAREGSWISQHVPPGVNLQIATMNRSPVELIRWSQWVRQERFDVIHTHMSRAGSFGVLMKMLTGIPVVATAHTNSIQVHWPFNDAILANSRSTENYYRKQRLIFKNRIRTCYCFTDLQRFDEVTPRDLYTVRNELRIKHHHFVVGVVGEVIPRKGQKYLIEAIPELIKQIPGLKIVFIGRFHRQEDYVQQLRRTQIENGTFRRVKWIGYRNNVPDFLKAMDVCVVPSLKEPLGLAALEGLAAGIPVVASDVGGLQEIIDHRTTGLLVPPGDSRALATAIIDVKNDAKLRDRLVANGKQWVETRFNPTSLTNEVVDVYRALMAVPKRKSA